MTHEEREIDMAACAFRLAYNEQVAKGRASGACLIGLRRVMVEIAGRDHEAIRQREAAREGALAALASLGDGHD